MCLVQEAKVPRPHLVPTATPGPVALRLLEAAETYTRKSADYAPDPLRPFENFGSAARFAARVCLDLPADDRRRATATLIGVKLSRLQTLGLAGKASNEAVEDTLGDLIVYLAILLEQQAIA
jgi:hypothetical protein